MARRFLCVSLSSLTLAATGALTAPALADAQMLRMVVQGVAVGNMPLARGYAACLLGGGTVEGVETALAREDFTRTDDTEMGVVTFTSPSLPFAISLYENGAICDVTSETLGIEQATMGLMIVATMTGFQSDYTAECTRMTLGGTMTAEITSSGNDPVCSDATTSNVRFTMAGTAAAAAPAAPAPTK